MPTGASWEMLKFHRTSLLTSKAQTVVNTVNTVGVMGKGLAAAFKERFPDMFSEYKALCGRGELKPGSFWLWKGPDQWVLNFATKKHWRNPSKIEYVRNGLLEFRERYATLGIREITFPRLGCGNGGLNWAEVRPLMVDLLHDLPITVYIHDFEYPIGQPEHDLPLMQVSEPVSFEAFCRDLREVICQRQGQMSALRLSKTFFVELDESFDLRDTRNSRDLLATEEDLFRIWSLLLEVPVSRFDLPDTAHNHALRVFSLLAELPYIRPINIASKSGRPNLAVEMIRRHSSERVPSSV